MTKRIVVKRPVRKIRIPAEENGGTHRSISNEVMSGDPLVNAKLSEQMYTVAEHSLLDMEYFQRELKFLDGLVLKYCVLLTDDSDIGKARLMTLELFRLQTRNLALAQRIRMYLDLLSSLTRDPFSHDARECWNEYDGIISEVTAFERVFRATKIKVFGITRRSVLSDHLLNKPA